MRFLAKNSPARQNRRIELGQGQVPLGQPPIRDIGGRHRGGLQQVTARRHAGRWAQ